MVSNGGEQLLDDRLNRNGGWRGGRYDGLAGNTVEQRIKDATISGAQATFYGIGKVSGSVERNPQGFFWFGMAQDVFGKLVTAGINLLAPSRDGETAMAGRRR